jgi:hypothetical protein
MAQEGNRIDKKEGESITAQTSILKSREKKIVTVNIQELNPKIDKDYSEEPGKRQLVKRDNKIAKEAATLRTH